MTANGHRGPPASSPCSLQEHGETRYTDCADKATEIGARGYIVKPIDRLTLLNRIRQALVGFDPG